MQCFFFGFRFLIASDVFLKQALSAHESNKNESEEQPDQPHYGRDPHEAPVPLIRARACRGELRVARAGPTAAINCPR